LRALSIHTHIRYSSAEKIKILAAVKNIMKEEGLSEREVCARFKIDYNLVPQWSKLKDDLQDPRNLEKLSIH
jgi:hypothetical protein